MQNIESEFSETSGLGGRIRGEFYDRLSALRDVEAKPGAEHSQLYFSVPRIVVIGEESSGKSSTLERLACFKFFPSDRRLCTRMPTELRLRFKPSTSIDDDYRNEGYVMMKLNKSENSCLPDIDDAGPLHPHEVEMKVKEWMENFVRTSNDDLIGIIEDCMVIELFSSKRLNLDVIDLPGIVAGSIKNEPSNMMELTRDLSTKYILHPHTIVVAVVPATEKRVRNSQAMELVQRCKKESLTIGALTMTDLSRDPRNAEDPFWQLKERLNGSADDLPLLGHGYVGLKNRDTSCIIEKSDLPSVRDSENKFFYENLLDFKNCGIDFLVDKLLEIVENYIKRTWVVEETLRLQKFLAQMNAAFVNLGPVITQVTDLINLVQNALPDTASDFQEWKYTSIEFVCLKSFQLSIKDILEGSYEVAPEPWVINCPDFPTTNQSGGFFFPPASTQHTQTPSKKTGFGFPPASTQHIQTPSKQQTQTDHPFSASLYASHEILPDNSSVYEENFFSYDKTKWQCFGIFEHQEDMLPKLSTFSPALSSMIFIGECISANCARGFFFPVHAVKNHQEQNFYQNLTSTYYLEKFLFPKILEFYANGTKFPNISEPPRLSITTRTAPVFGVSPGASPSFESGKEFAQGTSTTHNEAKDCNVKKPHRKYRMNRTGFGLGSYRSSTWKFDLGVPTSQSPEENRFTFDKNPFSAAGAGEGSSPSKVGSRISSPAGNEPTNAQNQGVFHCFQSLQFGPASVPSDSSDSTAPEIFRKVGEKIILVHPPRYSSQFSMIRPFHTKDCEKYYDYLNEFRLLLSKFAELVLKEVLNESIENILDHIRNSDNRFDKFHLALSEVLGRWCEQKKKDIKERWEHWVDQIIETDIKHLDYLFMPLPSLRFRNIVVTRLSEIIHREIRKATLNEYIGSAIFIDELVKHSTEIDMCIENCADQREDLKKSIETAKIMLEKLQEKFPLFVADIHTTK